MATVSSLKSPLTDLTWYNRANWTLGVPVAGVVARIAGKRSVTLRLAPPGGASATAGELSISAAAVGLVGGRLTFSAGSGAALPYDINLEMSASLVIGASAALSGSRVVAFGLDGTAAKMWVYGTVSEDLALVDAGQLTVAGTGHWITGSSGIAVGGANGARLVIANGGVVDEGRKGLSQWADSLSIGGGAGHGAVVVTGLGSLAAFTEVYGYVGEQPTGYNDPAGLCPWCVGAAFGAGADAFFQLAQNGWHYDELNWTEIGVSALVGGVTAGVGEFAIAGREICIGKNIRIAPFGNRTGNPYGKFPHYHRRGVDPSTGETIPGQGIGRHRPWETKSPDQGFGDRF